MVWASASAVCLTVLMVCLLIGVVLVNGLGYFWPSGLARAELADGKHILGEITGREPGAIGAPDNLRFKIGNRDLYGQDFRWFDGATIAAIDYPADAVMLERRQYGNFYGWLEELRLADSTFAGFEPDGEDAWARLELVLPSVEERRLSLEEKRQALANRGRRVESLRLQIIQAQEAEESDSGATVARLRSESEALAQRYQQESRETARLATQLRAHTALFREAGGREKEIPLVEIVRAVRPNEMSVWQKSAFYASKVKELLLDNPRESNTEGGLFPAIFGTVILVLIMSVFSLPLGVLAAIYLQEYARKGWLVRLVRIAVYNLAGVPSIVFGVFGLGFFVYGVGGGIDALFFSDRLPTPTFGTGGILWASLTLALLTVPVVIVATEEGLSAIPRGLREASLALGATRFQTLVRVVLPMATPGIITGFVLAMARAAGEVAPLMITGVVKLAPALPVDGTFPFIHLERKFMHLGFHIYDVGFQSPNVEAAKPMVYITTLLLILIVLVLSLTAIVLRTRMRRRFQTATF